MISILKSLFRVKELKSFLMRVKEESERAALTLNIKKKNRTKIMTSSPITSWQTKGEEAEVVTDFLFLGSAAAAKSLQLCPTLYDPIDGSPPKSLKW